MAAAARQNPWGMFLHACSVGSKFLLVLYMGKYLALEALGVYGLFVASSEIAQHLMSGGIGPHSVRELPQRPKRERSTLVWSQIRVQLGASAVVLPLCLSLFVLHALPWAVLRWFYPTVIGLLVAREVNRLLVAVDRPFAASVVTSCAQGLWIPWPLLLAMLGLWEVDLQVVLACWSAAAVLSALVGLWVLLREGLLARPHTDRDPRLGAGLRSAWVFLLLPLCQQLITFSDRYFVAAHWGDSATGIYTFHSSIARVLETLVYTGFVTPAIPAMVRAFARSDAAAVRAETRELGRRVALVTGVGVLLFGLGILIPLALLERPGLREALGVYFVLLARAAIANLSQASYLALFAAHRNRTLLLGAGGAALTNFMLNALLVPSFALLGAAAATLLSALLQAVFLATCARATRASPVAPRPGAATG